MNASKESAAQPAAKQESPALATPLMRPLEDLGRRLGNAGMRAWVQAKLSVSDPGDLYEQEADRVADQVMRMPATPPVQRKCAKCEDEVQRAAAAPAASGPTVDEATEHSIRGLSGRGAPLPGDVQSFMESRFQADFSSVRVHSDTHADQLARSVDARAFTVGSNIVFRSGQFMPETEDGKRLLAHELTHVIQQNGAGAPRMVARQVNPLIPERKPSIDDWLHGSRDLARLEDTDLQEGIDLLTQHQSFQNRSTADDFAVEQTLTSLRAEQHRRNKAADHQGTRGRKAGKSTAPPPSKHPRALTEKDVAYAGPEEQRSEYNLIMKWLARDDLPAKDRKVLLKERQMLDKLLAADRQRLAAERHAAKVQAALAPAAGGEASALLSMARTIEGIGKDPAVADLRYIYHRGERYAIGAGQAKSLHDTLASELKHVINRIESNAGMERERYDMQVQINREHRCAAFWSGLIGGAKDPGGEISATYVAVMAVYRQAHADLAAGRLVQAAARVPRLEQLTRELKVMSRGFQEDHIKGADRAITGLEFTRDAAFAVAGSIAAVVAAPVVAGFAGGLGLGTAGTAVVTTLGTSALVGSGMAVVRGTSAAVGTAAAGHSLREVASAWTDEAKRGFREGAISGLGGGATRALAPLLGVGASAGVQFVRRVAGEAIVNGTTTMLDVLWQGGSVEAAAKAAVRSALLSIPGSAVGGLNSRAAKFLLAPMTASATAYAGSILSGESVEVALARASTAMAVSLSMSSATHGTAGDKKLMERGEAMALAIKKRAEQKRLRQEAGLDDPRKLRIKELKPDKGPDAPPQPHEPYDPKQVEIIIPPPGQEPHGPQEISKLKGRQVVLAPVDESSLDPKKPNWDDMKTDPGIDPKGGGGGSSGSPSTPPTSAGPESAPTPSGTPHPSAQQQQRQQQQRELQQQQLQQQQLQQEQQQQRQEHQQPQQQQQAKSSLSPDEPTPRMGPAPRRLRPEEGGPISRIMRAIVFISGGKRRAIVVHGVKPHYQSLGESPSDVEGQPTFKEPRRWYHFLGIQEFETERKEILEEDSGVGRRGWYIKSKRMTSLDPNAALDNIAIEVEFETRSPERVNKWLFDQGAECFIAYEHNGLLRPIGEPPPIPRPPTPPSDEDTQP
jgi:hypothetical protein